MQINQFAIPIDTKNTLIEHKINIPYQSKFLYYNYTALCLTFRMRLI